MAYSSGFLPPTKRLNESDYGLLDDDLTDLYGDFYKSARDMNTRGNINEQLTRTTEVIVAIEEYLRGIKQVMGQDGVPVKVQGKPLIPHHIVDRLIVHLHARYNQHTILANLDMETIKRLAKEFRLQLVDFLADNFDEIEVGMQEQGTNMDAKDLDLVLGDMDQMHFMCLSRSHDGKTQDGLLGINKSIYRDFDAENKQNDALGQGWLMKKFGLR